MDDDRVQFLVELDVFDRRRLVDAHDPVPHAGTEDRRSAPSVLGL